MVILEHTANSCTTTGQVRFLNKWDPSSLQELQMISALLARNPETEPAGPLHQRLVLRLGAWNVARQQGAGRRVT